MISRNFHGTSRFSIPAPAGAGPTGEPGEFHPRYSPVEGDFPERCLENAVIDSTLYSAEIVMAAEPQPQKNVKGYQVIDDDGFPPPFFPSADGSYPAGLVNYVFDAYRQRGNFRVANGLGDRLPGNLQPLGMN
ncbi:hypothetical protein HYU13_06780 [Candidatus Woesearchaeota archaeon]|nr:hypothetical protein [Candidatus Woesearchaeota archaeon]